MTRCQKQEWEEQERELRRRAREERDDVRKLSLPLAVVLATMQLVQGVKRAARVFTERFAKAVRR